MTDGLPIDGSGGGMEPELRAFITTLRGAGPDEAELARMRASVLAAASGGAVSAASAATAKGATGATTTAATLGATAKGAIVLALLAAGTALPGDLRLPHELAPTSHVGRVAGAAEPAPTSHVGPATVSAMPEASTTGTPPASHVGPTTASALPGAGTLGAPPTAGTEPNAPLVPNRAQHAARQAGFDVARGAQQPVEPGAELGARDAARGAQQPAEDPDMVFEVGEVDPGVPAGDEGPPSEELANALRLYAQGEHAAAAAAVLPVLEGRTGDGRAGLARAQLAYARALFHLGLYHASAVAFDEITAAGASHPYFDASLPWLAELADHLPEPTLVIAQVGRYERAQLDRLDTEETRDRHQQLLYLLGRHRYGERRLGEAIALFRAVRPGSRYYVPARFFEGVSHVRERRARPGIAAFRAVIAAVDDGGVEDADRMRDLAWLSLARLYYSAANSRGADDGVQTNARAIGNAVDAWDRVDVESEYWLDALFEQSWALFLAGEEERALGRIHALNTPYFEGAYYPEALVLRAVIYFQHCHLDEAEGVVDDFHRRYDPVMDGLRRTLANHPEPLDAFALLERVRAGQGRFDPRVRAVVADVLDDRELLRNLAETESLRAEEARIAATPALGPDLSARLGQELAVERALAQARTGEVAHGRLERAVDDLQQRMNEMDAVLLEIQTIRRTGPAPAPRGRGDLSIEADQEHMVWPFDGEVWRDEVPYYRQQVRNRCVR